MASLLDEEQKLRQREKARIDEAWQAKAKANQAKAKLTALKRQITATRKGFIIEAWYEGLTKGELKPNELDALKSVLRRHMIKLEKRPDWEKRVKDNWAVLDDILADSPSVQPPEELEDAWRETA
jgi:hypothetical protein